MSIFNPSDYFNNLEVLQNVSQIRALPPLQKTQYIEILAKL